MALRSWMIWLLLQCMLSSTALASVEADWQFAKRDKGVEVYTGKVAGSKFLAFKASTLIPAPLQDVLTELTNHEGYASWYDNCESAVLLKQITPETALIRVVINTPFPLADRDAINRVTVTNYGDRAEIRLSSDPDQYPEQGRIVRMRQATGAWLLQTVEGGTEVVHLYHADPLARVPAWMVNRFIVEGPINSLSALRERVLR